MNAVNQVLAHQALLTSLHTSYPLTKRTKPLLNNSNQRQTTTNKILPTSYIANNSGNESSNRINKKTYNHLQDYLVYIQSGACLRDGINGIQLGTLVAVQPVRKNGLPWFGKVTKFVDEEQFELLWLHKEAATRFYYLDDSVDVIHKDTIICNGIEFEPVFGEKLVWRLLTPLPFIQAMNQDEENIPKLTNPVFQATPTIRKKTFDITKLAFNDKEEFAEYLYKYKT